MNNMKTSLMKMSMRIMKSKYILRGFLQAAISVWKPDDGFLS